ncbi:MAG: hypothetical protein Q4G21_00760 [Dermabacter sp.]|nr:hypothetical protein [Dermabacter sp.]
MAREVPELYTGKVTPGPVGWTRIAVTMVIGLVVAALAALQGGNNGIILAVVVLAAFGAYGAAMWSRLSITFMVDERGVTPSLGGFLPRPTWPASNFRTVQLRTVPADEVGATIGSIGLRTGVVTSSRLDQVSAVDGLKVLNPTEPQVPCTYAVTGGGALVEIIGRDGSVYLLSPTKPRECAEAIARVIRYTR